MLLLVFSLGIHAQSVLDVSQPPQISLLTIGPGEVFFERFGHNAIVVRGPAGEESAAYNYGIFDFDQQDFLLNFARGRMLYRMAVDALEDDVAMYRDEGRQITEQKLDLTAEQAHALVAFLEWNSLPENAQYRYDYFEANCSTRVRDALDRALAGALHAQSEGRSRGYTYRLDALRLMAPSPLLMLGIDLGLGPYADQRIDYWHESFVPATLSSVVEQVKLRAADGHEFPLVASTTALATGHVEEPPALPPDLRLPFLILGLALGLALTWLGHSRRAAVRIPLAIFAGTFELFCGVGGAVLLFLWLYTEHRAAWRNENLLLLSPLCLLLVPAWFSSMRANWRVRRMTVWVAWLVVLGAAFALFSKILPSFAQANLHWIVLFLPIHVALALTASRAPSRVHVPIAANS
ncbi:MAG: DUF4105 domain-containing protein [Dokdonella sp.]